MSNEDISPFIDTHDENLIIRIQKLYKIKRINKIAKKINFKKLDNKFSKLDYIGTIKLMMNRKLLCKINILMSRINRYLNPNKNKLNKLIPKIFLSAYMLKYQYNDFLTTIEQNNKKILYLQACELINFMNDIFFCNQKYKEYSINRFGVNFNSYYTNCIILQEQDKINLINEPYRHYSNLRTTIKYINNSSKYPAEQKRDIINVLEKEMKETENCVKLLDKNFDIKKFEEITTIEDKIKDKIKDEYWNDIEKSLANNNYQKLLIILKDIKKIIIELYPNNVKSNQKRSKREEVKINLDEYIDIEFIKQKIDNNVLDRDDIIAIADYLFCLVTDMQASVRDKDSDNMWNNIILKKFKDENMSIEKFIPFFFRKLYKIIDNIFSDILLIPFIK